MAFQSRQQKQNQMNGPTTRFLVKNTQGRRALAGIENNVNAVSKRDPFTWKSVSMKNTEVSKCSKDPQREHANIKTGARNVQSTVDYVIEDVNDCLMGMGIDSEAFSSSILPDGITDIDRDDRGNQFLCSDLVMDIYSYLRKLEGQYVIHNKFLSRQHDITPKMRSILVDWLNQVHARFGLLPETLYLTVAIIDRFLQEHVVTRKQLQLVGVTAMFIASKYEEIYSSTVDDFVYITDNAYSKRDIFKMEALMLKALQFSFGRPLPLHFLRRYSKAGNCDSVVHITAKYMMELSLQDYELATVPPSLLAAAALRLSIRILDNAPWTSDLEFYSGYSEVQTNSVMTLLANLVLRNGGSKLQAVKNKYGSSKQMKVSTFPQLRSAIMQEIAKGIIV